MTTSLVDTDVIARTLRRKYSAVIYCVLVLTLLTTVSGDYECLCSYKESISVHTKPGIHAFVGNLSFFDCKPTLPLPASLPWKAVAYEHKIGYVNLDQFTAIQTCIGLPSPIDVTPNMPLTLPSVGTLPPGSPLIVAGDTSLCPPAVLTQAVGMGSFLGQYRQSCYEVQINNMSWTQAEAFCHNIGGHLLTINDEDEQAFIVHLLLQTHTVKSAWIGLNDIRTEAIYQWSSGQPVTYTHMKHGHHDNNAGNDDEDCAIISDNGKWDDVLCGSGNSLNLQNGEQYGSICEFSIRTSQQPNLIGNKVGGVNSFGAKG